LYLRGSAFIKKRQYSEAIKDLTAAIDLNPQHLESFYDRGTAFSKIGQQDLAISDFSIVLHLNPDHVNAAFGRAACYNTMGHFSKAIEDYNFALMKDYQPEKRENAQNLFSSPNGQINAQNMSNQQSFDSYYGGAGENGSNKEKSNSSSEFILPFSPLQQAKNSFINFSSNNLKNSHNLDSPNGFSESSSVTSSIATHLNSPLFIKNFFLQLFRLQ
jgi:tetratricopeptide (TPR) repeat protein